MGVHHGTPRNASVGYGHWFHHHALHSLLSNYRLWHSPVGTSTGCPNREYSMSRFPSPFLTIHPAERPHGFSEPIGAYERKPGTLWVPKKTQLCALNMPPYVVIRHTVRFTCILLHCAFHKSIGTLYSRTKRESCSSRYLPFVLAYAYLSLALLFDKTT